MNPAELPPQHKEPPLPEEKKSNSPLNFSPDQARREARKLHQLREDLQTRRTVQETAIRSSPIGNDN
jgi:hypothetical protein